MVGFYVPLSSIDEQNLTLDLTIWWSLHRSDGHFCRVTVSPLISSVRERGVKKKEGVVEQTEKKRKNQTAH